LPRRRCRARLGVGPSGAGWAESWLFGGASIPTTNAIFDLESYPGTIVTDLFGECGYFADPDAFWAAQKGAVEAKKAEYLEAGWSEVVIIPENGCFSSWEHDKVSQISVGPTPDRRGQSPPSG
jgi:ParB family chromosome partitioning protein